MEKLVVCLVCLRKCPRHLVAFEMASKKCVVHVTGGDSKVFFFFFFSSPFSYRCRRSIFIQNYTFVKQIIFYHIYFGHTHTHTNTFTFLLIFMIILLYKDSGTGPAVTWKCVAKRVEYAMRVLWPMHQSRCEICSNFLFISGVKPRPSGKQS